MNDYLVTLFEGCEIAPIHFLCMEHNIRVRHVDRFSKQLTVTCDGESANKIRSFDGVEHVTLD